MDYANPRIEEIEKAFSIEKVTDEFFEQYKGLYLKLSEQLKSQPFFQKETEEENIQAVARFAKKLLGQIVFLYFLQKKKWLGVAKEGKWGDGSKRFMRERFTEITDNGGNYYHDFLQYLFYEALAKERKGQADPDYYERFSCKIPFLNGGLFEAEYDDWHNLDIDLPNSLFHNDEKNKAGDVGTGILDVFDRYNFTIKEDEPLEKEVAVDPEMLGKVFENMLEVTERKSKGAFYTPREIVHYMCQESLIHYLDNSLNSYAKTYQTIDSDQPILFGGLTDKKGQQKLEITHQDGIKVPKEDLETLIRKGHLFVENDEAALQALQRIESGEQKTTKHKVELPESIKSNAATIDKHLESIKVCDPAIGSGAFPVGLLHEIVDARLALAPHSGNSWSVYELKRHTIHESLYGVDIDASAVDIARLRLWLSLIVDEDDFNADKALPNLDYKIVCGNSLIGFPDRKGSIFEGSNAEERIENLKNEFFSEKDQAKKAKKKQQIDAEIQARMANSKQNFGYQVDFDFKLYFSEVWHAKDGFDVVIGNPPYFNIDVFGPKSDMQSYLKKHYDVYMDKSDILFYFFEKAIRISNGIVAFITSNAYFYADKAKKLRNHLLHKSKVSRLINFEKHMVFNDASITTAITILDTNDNFTKFINLTKGYYTKGELQRILSFNSNYLGIKLIPNESFVLIDPELQEVNSRIDAGKVTLGDLYKIGSGMQTGCNEVFLFKELPGEFPSEFLRKRMTGENIDKYVFSPSKELILYIEDVDEFECLPQTIREYLLGHQDILKKRADKKRRTTSKWWNFTFAMHKELYGNQKIWCSYRSNSNIFCLDETKEYIGLTNTTVVFNTNNNIEFKYILALLNSQVLTYRYSYIGKQTGNGLFEYFENGIRKLPIHVCNHQIQQIIVKIVDYIRLLKVNNSKLTYTYLEQLIDCLVYELYFPNEIKIANKEILKHLGDLKPITDDMSDEEKLAVIQDEFDRFYDPKHPVRNNLETLDSVEEVRIIREALKR
jgi:hypothetical protein